MGVYHNIDIHGLIIGFCSFLLVILYGIYLLNQYDLKDKIILFLLGCSAAGHIGGAFFYYWYSLHAGSDSTVFFQSATQKFGAPGFQFVCFILGNLKFYLLGDSLLGAFLFSGALGLLGSIFYLLTFKVLLDKMIVEMRIIDSRIIFFPALLLLCWPSYFIWSAGIGKDSFIFLFTAIFLFILARGKMTILSLTMLALVCSVSVLIRPYLFVIAGVTTFIYLAFDKKLTVSLKLSIVLGGLGLIYVLLPHINNYIAFLIESAGFKITSLGDYIIYQQALMQEANASLPIPTYNPKLILLFWPYLMGINLFLPLGYGAMNLMGLISSLENTFFLGLVLFFIFNWKNWQHLRSNVAMMNYLFIYFLVGIACLSILNTNLGLAMREKMMFVPALLIIIFLVQVEKKIASLTKKRSPHQYFKPSQQSEVNNV